MRLPTVCHPSSPAFSPSLSGYLRHATSYDDTCLLPPHSRAYSQPRCTRKWRIRTRNWKAKQPGHLLGPEPYGSQVFWANISLRPKRQNVLACRCQEVCSARSRTTSYSPRSGVTHSIYCHRTGARTAEAVLNTVRVAAWAFGDVSFVSSLLWNKSVLFSCH